MSLWINIDRWVVLLGATGFLVVTPASAQSEKISEARASVAWLETYDCPKIGFPISVPGLESEAQILVQKRENLAFVNQTVSAITSARQQRAAALYEIRMSGNEPSRRTQEALSALDAGIRDRIASASTALVQWVLAEYVAISRIPAGFSSQDVNTRHPLSGREQELQSLENAALSLSESEDAHEFINPIPQAYRRCLGELQSNIAESQREYVEAALLAAQKSTDLDPIISRFEPISWTRLGIDPSGILSELKAERDILYRIEQEASRAERERLERERLERAERERAEEERRREEERQRILQAAQANLPNAQQFVSGMRGANINLIDPVLASTVQMRSPNQSGRMQTRSGKSQVLSAFRNQFADPSASAPSITDPQINSSGTIVSTIRASGRTAWMTLTFNDRNEIIRIVIQR